jgi:hypothetical protein
MIQCKDCEFYRPGPGGRAQLLCNPFETIKEPECLAAPMQEKMFQVIEREIDDISEADRWKVDDDEDDWDPMA